MKPQAIDARIKQLTINGMAETMKSEGAVTKGGRATVDGRAAVVLADSTGESVYVAADGEPLPLRIG